MGLWPTNTDQKIASRAADAKRILGRTVRLRHVAIASADLRALRTAAAILKGVPWKTSF
jgi:hypothetical protein